MIYFNTSTTNQSNHLNPALIQPSQESATLAAPTSRSRSSTLPIVTNIDTAEIISERVSGDEVILVGSETESGTTSHDWRGDSQETDTG